jgi:hypothetical protein
MAIKLKKLFKLALRGKPPEPIPVQDAWPKVIIQPMEGDLTSEASLLPALNEDELPEVEHLTLQHLIRTNKKVLLNNKPLDLLHIIEDVDDPLHQMLNIEAGSHGATYQHLITEKQPPHGVEPIISASRTLHGGGWWRSNPFTNVQHILYVNPVNALPISMVHTNPTLKLITAFTEVPKRNNVFEAMCEFSNVVILPEGVYVPATVLGKAKRVLYFQTPAHLAKLCINMCRQSDWIPKDVSHPLIKVYEKPGSLTRFEGLINPDHVEQEGVIYLQRRAVEASGLQGTGTFKQMLAVIDQDIDALYLKEDVQFSYQSFIKHKSVSEILLRLMKDGLRLDTVYTDDTFQLEVV